MQPWYTHVSRPVKSLQGHFCECVQRNAGGEDAVRAGLPSPVPPAAVGQGQLAEGSVLGDLLPHRLFDDLPGVGRQPLHERSRFGTIFDVAPCEVQGGVRAWLFANR